MKILVNLSTLTQSGVIPIWLRKFQELSKLGHKIDILYNNQPHSIDLQQPDINQYNQSKSILELPRPNSKLKFIFYALQKNWTTLKQIHKFSHKYDVIYSPSSVLDLAIVPFFLKRSNPKIIWTTVFDNIVPITDPGNKITRFLSWVFFQLSLILIRQADIVYTISPELKTYLIKHNFQSQKVFLTGNGIEIEQIKQSKKTKKQIDALFIGRINETKGIFDMLKVLSVVKQKFPNFTLAIMGNGDDTTKNKFKKEIKNLDLCSNVKFLGYISGIEKFQIIKSSRCFWFLSVSPSESFGIALMEAVSSGLPAFTYDLPVFKKIYQHHEVIFSPIHRSDIVAKKVIKLFQSKNFYNKNGPKLLGKYSWENIAQLENQAIVKLFSHR